MTNLKGHYTRIGWTVLIVFLPLALLALAIAYANRTSVAGDPSDLKMFVRITHGFVLFAWVVLGCVYGVLVWAGVGAYLDHRRQSSLFIPVTAAAGLLWLVFSISALASLDALTHKLALTWHLTDDLEVRLLNALLIEALVMAFAAALVVALRAEVSRRAQVAVVAAIAATGVAAVILVLTLPN